MYYRQLRAGVNDKNYQLVPADQSQVQLCLENPSQDYYTSLYKYSEPQYRQFLKTGSIKGISDVVTNWLVFDFDSKEDLNLARQDAKEICLRLGNSGVHPNAMRISYSGSKGYHVEVRLTEDITVDEFKAITKQLASGLKTFDQLICDYARPFRVLGSVNLKTGLYKIPLHFDELAYTNIEEIKDLAKNQKIFEQEPIQYETIDLPPALQELKKFKEEYKPKTENIETGELDWSKKPKWLSNCKYSLQNGYFGEGLRNSAFLCLAATFKNQGDNKDIAYGRLMGVAETQSKVNKCPMYENELLYKNIICQVYGDGWKNGTSTCKDKSSWLYDYCQSLGNHKCNHKDDEEQVIKVQKLEDIRDSFKEYVTHIEKNTILTGLPSLDNKVFLSTGANVGIIGAPGCHAKGTEILMHDGTIKKVEDVIVGDKLMGPDSLSREVLKLCRGREQMVKIKPLRSQEFIVNKSHILHLSPSHLKQNKCIVGNLNIKVDNYIKSVAGKDGPVLKGYKLIKSSVDFSKKELIIDPYILGLWLGDGHSDSPSLTTMDDEIKETWVNYGTSLGLRIRKQEQKNNKSSIYSFANCKGRENLFTQKLRKYNLKNNKHIPFDYLTSSREDRLQLLAGLIDTDGSLEANKIGWNYVSKLKVLADNTVYLARSLGFHASISKRTKFCMYKGEKRFGQYYYVYISGVNCLDVPIKLPRKKPRIQKMTNNVLHQGFDYEILPEDDFYGFTLDKDHLYLTSDFFIHHNSGKTSIALDILNHTSKAGVPSVLASLDMHKNRLFEKVLYRVSGKKRNELYDIFKNNQEDEIMEKIKEEFGNVNFFHKSCPTVADIKKYILTCEEQSGQKIKLVMLDYFERVTNDFNDDTAASKKVAGDLQDLVNELGICLVTLVQPNKNALAGSADNPILSYTNIKGSSYVYQAFRIIWSIWRPFYNPQDFSDDKYMQMAILKNDLGELSELTFGWNGPQGRIYEIDNHEKQEFEEMLMKKAEKKANEKKNDSW